jgi:hypothetical protein
MKNTQIKVSEAPSEIPEIHKVSVEFGQEGNTLGTTSNYETITIGLEFQLGEKEGSFITIKTDGWSIDDIYDLDLLVNQTKKVLQK